MADNRGFANHNTVDEIKSRCNIVDVIGRVVTLKKAGSTFKGLCPFHNEKTPSFVVYETTQTFKCFGCNAGGDVFNFVQKYYNLDFREAVEMLAKEYGVEITSNFSDSRNNDEYYEINRLAARFFYKALREKPNPGLPYMRNRGITDETLKRFGIGYADGEWTSLTDYLVGEGYEPDKLVELGLVSKKEKRYYDKFRNRVIFPIQNTAGKVIGFGGRILDDGQPKYLNSSESSVFRKKNNLYGLNVARDYIKRDEGIILVEGYMDVISLFQAGIRNVSASLGTALTENQARLIKRYTENVILSYDADNAGQKAALRGLDILYDTGCRARVLVVNEGKDPDEFIKQNGREAFLKLADNALYYGDFKLAKAKEKYDLSYKQQIVEYLKEAVSILRGMNPVEADMYIGQLAQETGISEMAIRKEYQEPGSNGEYSVRKHEKTATDFSSAEKDLLKLMLIDSAYTHIPDDIKEDLFTNDIAGLIFRAIEETDNGERPLDMNRLRDRLDIESSEALDVIDALLIPQDKEKKIFADCISHIRKKKLIKEDLEITEKLTYEKVDSEEAERLMKRQLEIQKIIKGAGDYNGN